MQNIDKIFICAHCNRAGYGTRGWPPTCKAHALQVRSINVILKNNDLQQGYIFYDPNLQHVQAKRKMLGLNDET